MACPTRCTLGNASAVLWILFLTCHSHAVRLDIQTAISQWHELAVEPGETPLVCDVQEKKLSLPELAWLPEYKWREIYQEPCTVKDRAWSLTKSHVLPVSTLFFSSIMAKSAGWLAGRDNKVIKDIGWRVGDALSDAVQSYTPQELFWRLSVSNLDLFRPPKGDRSDWIIYYLKRSIVYLPGLYYLIPEVLWELAVIGAGNISINIEPVRLQEYMELTYFRSGSKKDLEAPPFSHLDLEIVSEAPSTYSAESVYEAALVELNQICARDGINRIRFYPVIQSYESGSGLELYIQIFAENKPGALVRFPASFGPASEMDWWTNALDQHTLQGVYNKQDQFRLFQAWNKWRKYDRPLANPFSEQILVSLTRNLKELITAGADRVEPATGCRNQTCWRYYKPDINNSAEKKDFVALSVPRQSVNHTIISAGSKGVFFIDDHISQRVMEPRISLLTHVSFVSTSTTALVGLETRLPWLPSRGEVQIASSFVTSMFYGYLTRKLFSFAMEEQKKKQHPRFSVNATDSEESQEPPRSVIFHRLRSESIVGDRDTPVPMDFSVEAMPD
ncbi:hypothetical protein M3P05_00835 [Sansalvadorimonas sp. 2012CJ34-2]|uniref:Uncharacterized protein n=1 Tax=Parendozoicomonas callyspongiae TaxID=2942213 RepID=A0ABT0PBT4_9GAMM|nr:hypothetical protein [Sansalvadorimonas sp. 2012CJ34-2]MCL6268496.1 hypothetical protein [Sansalvadorimonas sp. 2012CJ34-2]